MSNRFSKTVRCALRSATTSIRGDARLAAALIQPTGLVQVGWVDAWTLGTLDVLVVVGEVRNKRKACRWGAICRGGAPSAVAG